MKKFCFGALLGLLFWEAALKIKKKEKRLKRLTIKIL
jgi:hypothetical protein